MPGKEWKASRVKGKEKKRRTVNTIPGDFSSISHQRTRPPPPEMSSEEAAKKFRKTIIEVLANHEQDTFSMMLLEMLKSGSEGDSSLIQLVNKLRPPQELIVPHVTYSIKKEKGPDNSGRAKSMIVLPEKKNKKVKGSKRAGTLRGKLTRSSRKHGSIVSVRAQTATKSMKNLDNKSKESKGSGVQRRRERIKRGFTTIATIGRKKTLKEAPTAASTTGTSVTIIVKAGSDTDSSPGKKQAFESKKRKEEYNGSIYLEQKTSSTQPEQTLQSAQKNQPKFSPINENSHCFYNINNLINEMKEMRSRCPSGISQLRNLLNHFLLVYEDFRTNYISAFNSKQSDNFVNPPSQTTLLIGGETYLLKNKDIEPFFQQNKRLTEEQKIRLAMGKKIVPQEVQTNSEAREKTELAKQKSSISYGTHYIVYVKGREGNEGFYLKLYPDSPAGGFARKYVGEALKEPSLNITQLIFAWNGRNKVTALASEEIPGNNLRSWLEANRKVNFEIVRRIYAIRFAIAVLFLPCDDKLDNNIAQVVQKAEKIILRVFSIDDGDGLNPPIVKRRARYTGETDKYYMECKTFIWCMENQMNQSIDPEFLKEFLELSPEKMVIEILRKLLEKIKYYKTFAALLDEAHRENIFLRIPHDTFVVIYKKLCKMQSILRENPDIKYKALLKELMPVVAAFYEYMRKANDYDTYKTLQAIYDSSAPSVEKVLEEAGMLEGLQEALTKTYYRTNDDLYYNSVSIEKACKAFFSNLSFRNKSPELQDYLRRQMITFPFLTHITIEDYKKFSDEDVKGLAFVQEKLKNFTLLGPNNVTATGLIKAFRSNENCHITLDYTNIKAKSSDDLYRIANYFENLIIRIDGSDYPVSKRNIGFLCKVLHRRKGNEDNNLIKFAIRSGFALYPKLESKFNGRKESPVHIAIEQGDCELAKIMLAIGVPVNIFDEDQQSLLDVTINNRKKIKAEKRQELVAVLLRHGARQSRPFYLFNDRGRNRRIKIALLSGFKALKSSAQWDKWLWKGMFKLMANTGFDREKLSGLFKKINIFDIFDRRLFDEKQRSQETSPKKLPFLDLSGPFNIDIVPLDKLTWVERINLVGCSGVTKVNLMILAAAGVEQVDLSLSQIEEAGLIDLNRICKISPFTFQGLKINITTIKLFGKKINGNPLENLHAIVTNKELAAQIVHFELSKFEITYQQDSVQQDSGNMYKLLGRLSNLTNLRTLIMNENNFYDTHICAMFATNSGFRNLSSINLQNNKISPPKETEIADDTSENIDGIKTLAEFFRQCRRLTDVRLSKNPLGDEGCAQIIAALRSSNPKLKRLELFKVGAGVKSLDELIACARDHKTFVRYDFNENHPTGFAEEVWPAKETELEALVKRNGCLREDFSHLINRIPEKLPEPEAEPELSAKGEEKDKFEPKYKITSTGIVKPVTKAGGKKRGGNKRLVRAVTLANVTGHYRNSDASSFRKFRPRATASTSPSPEEQEATPSPQAKLK